MRHPNLPHIVKTNTRGTVPGKYYYLLLPRSYDSALLDWESQWCSDFDSAESPAAYCPYTNYVSQAKLAMSYLKNARDLFRLHDQKNGTFIFSNPNPRLSYAIYQMVATLRGYDQHYLRTAPQLMAFSVWTRLLEGKHCIFQAWVQSNMASMERTLSVKGLGYRDSQKIFSVFRQIKRMALADRNSYLKPETLEMMACDRSLLGDSKLNELRMKYLETEPCL